MITQYKTKHIFQPVARNVLANGSKILNSLMKSFHKEKRRKSNNLTKAVAPVYN